ncbi:MAG: ABC transporter permease subunit [Candidatus Methanoplasma sp.]|jgi:thiamine transport system permease protein|nr:ABC transporter permease subunit [Candidatus Methanoplasma sp.]
MSLFKRINDISNNNRSRKAWFSFVCLIFLILIIIPSVYVILNIFTEWGRVSEVMDDPVMMSAITGALWNSFSIAAIVTVIDILVGIPMAWIFVRKQFKGKKYLDTLMDMPLAFPTAVVGISAVMFWGAPAGIDIPGLGIVVSPYLMMILLHAIFTFPYMVRSLSAILEQIEPNYETAAMTLSASRFTAVRTITLPLFRAGLVTGTILCFARSLSETGGTYIALSMMGVDSTFFTGPTFIAYMKDLAKVDPTIDPTGALILISVLMIILALILLIVVKTLITKFKIPIRKVWPQFGRLLSRGAMPKFKDAFSIAFLVVIVLLPTFYIFTFLTQPMADINYGALLSAVGVSFLIAGIAVGFNIVFGTPIALYIARKRDTTLGRILDNLVNVPLIIPTTALGFSLALFWGSIYTGGVLSIVMVIMGHIAFTFPLVVRNITGAVEEVDASFEEVAMTLGAKPFQAFSKVLMPIIKSSIIAGAILAFTRSLGETGATIAIDPTANTVPVYITTLVKAGNYSEAAFCSIVLIVICFVLLFAIKIMISRGGRRA